jgi:hypothetical protein
MNKTESMKKALEHTFWANYSTLNERNDYTFSDLFPMMESTQYEGLFGEMVDKQELPLVPVIPLQNNGTVTRFALDFY